MRLFDYIRRYFKGSPRVVNVKPGRLTIEARGCRVIIDDARAIDRLGRELTTISVEVPDTSAFQLIAKPIDVLKSRHRTIVHVAMLKGPRKPKAMMEARHDDIDD